MNNLTLVKSHVRTLTMFSFYARTRIIVALIVGAVASSRAEEVYLLQKLLLSDSEQKAAVMNPAASGAEKVVVENLPLFATPAFEQRVSRHFGQPISTTLLNELIRDISEYAKEHDRLIAKVQIPNQNVTAGALRLGVIIGRYNQFEFKGNRWFSSKLLQEKLGIKPGDEVRLSTLEEAVAWVNTNPFRRVEVLINDLAATPGKADLIVGVRDARPYRLAFAYDNSGSPIIGENHYTASVQLGNLWGADHQASYQFITTDPTGLYQAHSFDYKIPLRWRHFIQLSGAYVRASPGSGGLVEQVGRTVLGSLRYTVPIRAGDNPVEFYTALEFKQTDNSLDYQVQSFGRTIDIFQLTTGGSMVRRDRQGAWLLATSVTASPGGINSRNTTEAFSSSDLLHFRARYRGRADYIHGSIAVQRLQNFKHDWSLFSRLSVQASTANLVPNEQISIGGANSVRGFGPNGFSGDHGYIFANDLQSPAWKTKLLAKKSNALLETRFVVFYDAGQVFFRHSEPFGGGTSDSDVLRPIASTGVGIRTSLGRNFSATFDYGWQVTHPIRPIDDHHQGHVKVILAF